MSFRFLNVCTGNSYHPKYVCSIFFQIFLQNSYNYSYNFFLGIHIKNPHKLFLDIVLVQYSWKYGPDWLSDKSPIIEKSMGCEKCIIFPQLYFDARVLSLDWSGPNFQDPFIKSITKKSLLGFLIFILKKPKYSGHNFFKK